MRNRGAGRGRSLNSLFVILVSVHSAGKTITVDGCPFLFLEPLCKNDEMLRSNGMVLYNRNCDHPPIFSISFGRSCVKHPFICIHKIRTVSGGREGIQEEGVESILFHFPWTDNSLASTQAFTHSINVQPLNLILCQSIYIVALKRQWAIHRWASSKPNNISNRSILQSIMQHSSVCYPVLVTMPKMKS